MDVDLPGVKLVTLVHLQTIGLLASCVFAVQEGGVEHVPNLLINAFGRVLNLNDARDGSGHVSLDVDERALGVDLDHLLCLSRRAHVTHMASHFAALEDLAWLFAHTDGARSAMGLTHSVGSVLHVEIPPLDDSLVTLTLAHSRAVHQLTQLEVAGSETVA